MSTNLDEVRQRLELQLTGANKVLNGFKAEIADDIRPQVVQLFEQTSQEMQAHLESAITEARERLEQQFGNRLRLLTILSAAALALSLISLAGLILRG